MVLRLGIERSFLKLALSFSLRIGIAFRSLQHTIEAKAERVAIFLGGKKRKPTNPGRGRIGVESRKGSDQRRSQRSGFREIRAILKAEKLKLGLRMKRWPGEITAGRVRHAY